ncbi:MAG: hypothetical protein VX460_03180 [Planctomycetota bacterium]|nr:hypothetical protein [Planctomycetota bacterium]
MEEVPELDGGAALLARLPAPLAASAARTATTLREAGYLAWIVGGAVRDLLLGRTPDDVDLVTDALPHEVTALFDRTVSVGIAFGVVIVLDGEHQVEVATLREERGYSDRRRPDEVRYTTDPAIDARRRDFTCNALFLDPMDGRLLDPTGGASDLDAGVLRAVGEPAERFREDGLRLLRMARFSGCLGLEPAPGLLAAATAERRALDGVSPERVLDELLKIVRREAGTRDVQRSLELLQRCGLAERCIPSWPGGAGGDARVLLVGAVEAASPPAGPEVLLAALMPEDVTGAEGALRALRASNALRESVRAIVSAESRVADAASATLSDLDDEELGALVDLWRDGAGQGAALLRQARTSLTDPSAAVALRAGWARIGERAATAPEPAIELTAADLLDLGVARGPALGEGLRRVRLASLGGAFSDRDGALAWARAVLR